MVLIRLKAKIRITVVRPVMTCTGSKWGGLKGKGERKFNTTEV